MLVHPDAKLLCPVERSNLDMLECEGVLMKQTIRPAGSCKREPVLTCESISICLHGPCNYCYTVLSQLQKVRSGLSMGV